MGINRSVKYNFKLNFGIILFYRLILDISYIILISKVFIYEGFYLLINPLKLYESYLGLIFLVILYFFCVFKNISPSTYLLYIVFLFSYIPLGSFYGLTDNSRLFFYYCTLFWLFTFVFYKIIPKVKFISINSSKLFYFLVLVMNLIAFFLVYKYLGISLNFDLTLVYGLREKYIETKIPFAGYIFNWVGYVINPLLINYLTFKKNFLLLSLVIIWQFILFSQTGLKSFLFVPVLILGILWIYKKYGIRNIFRLTPLGLSFLILISILSYFILNDIWLSSLFVRRTLYVPARLSFYYYDFFSSHGPTFLSQHRIFEKLVDYPYHLDPPHLIGEVYFGTPKMGANNGILGDGYMNFGYLGIVIWGFIFVLLLKIYDSFTKEENKIIMLGSLAVFVNVFVNSALLTALTTHGFLILLVLTIFLPRGVSKIDKN